MDYSEVSPKYLMELIPKVSEAIWAMFDKAKYQNVKHYIEHWHSVDWNNFGDLVDQNFRVYFSDEEETKINLDETLHNMPPDILIKIAIELGIDTPGFLPAIPTFKNVLKDENQSAYQNFNRATKNVQENPDEAVSLASSTLEGIIKTILEHEAFAEDATKLKNLSLSKLVSEILKRFGMNDKAKAPQEIITIASRLSGIGGSIDDLRSDKSTAHGKTNNDYVVDDPLWSEFTVNATATVGLFLWRYFQKKYLPATQLSSKADIVIDIDDRPIDLSEIPF